jgi:hypothetical protein
MQPATLPAGLQDTNPNQTAGGAAVTANTISVTQTAAQDFSDAASSLQAIYNSVFESGSTLSSQAMITSAGALFTQAINRWSEDFWDIYGTLTWMAQQLNDTATQMLNNEQHNAELAQGLSAAQLPGYGSFPAAS